MMRLLRPSTACAHIGIFLRSFRSHRTRYAREMIAEICSMGDALATAIITRTGSYRVFCVTKAAWAGPDAESTARRDRPTAPDQSSVNSAAGTGGPK